MATSMHRKHIKPGMFVLVELENNMDKLPIDKQIVVVVKQTKHGLWQVRYDGQYYSIPQRTLRKVSQKIFNSLNSIDLYNKAIVTGVNGVHELMLDRDDITKDLYERALDIYLDTLNAENVHLDLHVNGDTYTIIAHVPVFTIEWDINIDS